MSSVERTASGANPGLLLWWRWVWHRVDVTSHLRHWRSLACQNCNWDKEIYIYYIYYLFISTRLSIYYIPTSCDHCILYNFLSRQIFRETVHRCFIISHLSFLCACKIKCSSRCHRPCSALERLPLMQPAARGLQLASPKVLAWNHSSHDLIPSYSFTAANISRNPWFMWHNVLKVADIVHSDSSRPIDTATEHGTAIAAWC